MDHALRENQAERSRPSALGLSIILALCGGILLALFGVLAGRWNETASHLDLMVRARALAEAVSRVDTSTDAGEHWAQDLVTRAKETFPDTRSILVLEGVYFVAHTDPTLAGTRLKRTVEHKALYDDIDELADHLERNLEERKKYPDLKRNPYETAIVETRDDGVFAAAPILEGTHDVRGIVALEAAPEPVRGGPMALLLSLLTAALIVAAWWMTRVGGRSAQVAVGAAFLVLSAALVQYQVTRTSRNAQAHLVDTVEAAYQVWNHALASAKRLSPPPRAASLDDFLTAVNQTRRGDPAPWFTARTQGAQTARSLEAGGGAPEFAPGPALHVDSRWAWRGYALSAVIMLFYLALLVTGRTERIAAVFREHWYAYAYVAPAVIGALILVFGPFLFAIGLAFYTRIYNTYEFVGLKNFVEILSNFHVTESRNFYRTLGVTVMWTVVNVSLHVSIGLGLAMLLKDKSLKFTPVYRTLLIIPWALPNYITALIWKGMFNKEYGAVNAFLGLIGIEPISWFTTFWGAFTANLVTNVWLGFPFMMVISLGALQSIPADLYEAADVDGAGRWDKFRRITLPLLKPALFPAIILGIIWTFNNFNIIYLVSGGAPDNKTDILITEAYRWAFEKYQYGYASAYSLIIFLILFTYTYVTNKITKSTEGAYE